MIKSLYKLVLSLILGLVVLLPSTVYAAVAANSKKPSTPASTINQLSSNGFRISPIRTDITVPAGTSQTIPITVDNLTKDNGYVKVQIDDFTAGNNENGQPYILLNGAAAPSHSLKNYVEPIAPFPFAPFGSVTFNAVVKIPAGTSAGGYYGALRILPYDQTSGKNVNLSGSVASLFLVTVPGKVFEQMSISSFDVRKLVQKPYTFSSPGWLFSTPKNLYAVVRFNNTGDLQEQPFGKIILKKGGTVLDTVSINNSVPLSAVLPSSVRLFDEPLSGLGSFGKYTIYGNFGYGSDGQLLSDTYSFYVIPTLVFIIIGIIIIILLFLIFVLPRILRSYRRRILSRSNRSRW